MAILVPLFRTLEKTGVRYVVVGGLAVVLHGHARLTVDVDLVVDPEPEASAAVVEALTSLGLAPRLPVDPAAFADPETRNAWARERGMRVFSLVDPGNPVRAVDLFMEPPLPFEELWSRAVPVDLGDVIVRIASIPDLVRMKRAAGRPVDIEDVEALLAIQRERGEAPE